MTRLDNSDAQAVLAFAAAMDRRMAEKARAGLWGWNRPDIAKDKRLVARLLQSAKKRKWVDVGNFAMMLFHRDAADAEAGT